MEGMEDKLGAILNNPQMMQQIMSMAQSLGQSTPQQQMPPPQQELPQPDMAALQKLAGLAGQSGIDAQQQALLQALNPYLSRNRVNKLEKAMRAAKMARLATGFLNQGGLSLLTGR